MSNERDELLKQINFNPGWLCYFCSEEATGTDEDGNLVCQIHTEARPA